MSSPTKDDQPLSGDKLARHIEAALAVEMPRGREARFFYQVVKRVFQPVLAGIDRIPQRPCLFVGNHSLFALDGAVVGPMVQHEVGRFLRPMGDKFLWANSRVGDLIVRMGGVMGHPEVCSALMQHGHDILVFPGGAHEAVKSVSERYQLKWKERYGFVKLAAKYGYTIMPFGLVGPDEFYDQMIESDDLPDSALGQLLQRAGIINEDTRRDILPPIPLGALGSFLPKPQRCFLGFGQPVDLASHLGKTPSAAQQRKIRDRVAAEIEQQLAEMMVLRSHHRPEEGLLRRLLTL